MRNDDVVNAGRLCCVVATDSVAAKGRLELPALASQGLSIFYGDRKVVDAVSLGFVKHRITALVGPSGSGKSSYLHCLNRLNELIAGCRTEGDVCFDGRSIRSADVDPVALRLRIAMIFQRPTPFALSIRANIALGLDEHFKLSRSERDGRVIAALEQVGLWREVADRLDASALALSGGQQQRLCLARALALSPDVLLLDEPCSALDPMSTAIIEDLVTGLKSRTTIVMVTHNLAQAKRVADDMAILWNTGGAGQLIEYGRAADVFNSPRHETSALYIGGARG